MFKLSASSSLFFALVSMYTIQTEGHGLTGMRTKRSAETFGHSTTPDDSRLNLCENTTIDAAFYLKDGKLYVFKGAYYWVAVNDKLEPGYPKLAKETWQGLPSKIDTAFSYKNDEVLFFSGSIYWKYSTTKLEPGYPKLISDGLPGIPDNIQAASVWGKNGLIYFFKGNHYWRYDPERVPPVKSAYPKAISDGWDGIPNDLDAMTFSMSGTTKGITYFVKGTKYWRFDDEKLTIYNDPKYASYPRLTASWWFGCSKQDP